MGKEFQAEGKHVQRPEAGRNLGKAEGPGPGPLRPPATSPRAGLGHRGADEVGAAGLQGAQPEGVLACG